MGHESELIEVVVHLDDLAALESEHKALPKSKPPVRGGDRRSAGDWERFRVGSGDGELRTYSIPPAEASFLREVDIGEGLVV